MDGLTYLPTDRQVYGLKEAHAMGKDRQTDRWTNGHTN